MKSFLAAALLSMVLLAATSIDGFSLSMNSGDNPIKNNIAKTKEAGTVSRGAFVMGTMGALLAPTVPAFAKENAKGSARGIKDANFQGTDSPENQRVCMDRCIYECTKKGKTKEECKESCGEKCADPKAQMTYKAASK